MMAAELTGLLARGFKALEQGDLKTAETYCQQILKHDPKYPQAHFLVGLSSLAMNNRRIAAQAFQTVTRLAPDHVGAWAHLAHVFSQLGLTVRADNAINKAEQLGTENPMIANVMGAVYTTIGEYKQAVKWYEIATQQQPRHADYGVNLANALNFLGQTEAAKTQIEYVLAHDTGNPQAHWIHAGLHTAQDDRLACHMRQLAQKKADQPRASAFLYYGAGKLFEDIQSWSQAFDCFAAGAHARRQTIHYDEANEKALFTALHAHFDKNWCHQQDGLHAKGPIFIVGQPRTGTTLVERILSAHTHIHAAGELQQFYLSLRRLSQVETPQRLSAELIRLSTHIKPESLGRAYLNATRNHSTHAPYFIDKMPVNYLYIPLIARALPNARIIHIRRGAMDSCFSSFKQLFADAYLHSYDLGEMVRHHVRYQKLMQYWRSICQSRLFEISYEALVRNVETHARDLLDFLGLEWQQACIYFHTQDTAVATASSVQVRNPAHTRSVGRWKHYSSQLTNVAQYLHDNDIALE